MSEEKSAEVVRRMSAGSEADRRPGGSDASWDLARRACAALSAFDPEGVIAVCDPEIEFESRITAIDEGAYRGYDGIRRWISRLSDAFEWMEIEPLEVLDNDDRTRMIAVNRFRARGAGSGTPVEQQFVQAIELRQDKATSWSFFDSKAEALRAFGMSE